VVIIKHTFRSIAKELKALITDKTATEEDLEKELAKLKYSISVKTAARYHFRDARKQ
jgi:hypothetical protein